MVLALERLNHELLEYYGVEIAARTGVNTGEVVANSDPNAEQRLATGDAVNVAARLEQAAPANEVLIGDLTYSLVRSQVEVEAVEPLELKGKAERVPAYRLITVRDAAAVAERGAQESPLVGRDEQIGQLHDALDRGRDARRLPDRHRGRRRRRRQVAPRRDVPGRARRARDRPPRPLPPVRRRHHVLAARSRWPARPPASSTTTRPSARWPSWPRRSTASRARTTSSSGSPRSSACRPARSRCTEIFWAARKYLEALAMRRPVVVVIEDAHNGEETFLDLLEHLLANTSKQASLLVVATGRLGLLEKRPEWGSRPGRAGLHAAAGRRRHRAAGRGAARRLRRPGRQRPDRRLGRRQPAVRVAARLAARRQGPDPPRRRRLGGDRRPRRGRGPAHDPGAARVAPRRPVARGAGGHGAGGGHRAVVPAAGRRGAGPGRAPAVGAGAPAARWTASSSSTGPARRAARTRSTGSATS